MKDFFDTIIMLAGLIWLASTDKAEENEMRLQFGEVTEK